MANVGNGAPLRRDLSWAVDAARFAIALAIVGQIVISTIPGQFIYAVKDGSFEFDSWAYHAVVALSTASSVAAVVAIAVIPLVGIWVLTDPPRWLRWGAAVIALLVAFVILQSVALAIPALSYWAELQWLRPPPDRSVFSILWFLPFMVHTWISVLVLIAVLCARAGRPMLTVIAALLGLLVLGFTLAQYNDPGAPEGKALVLILAGVWLWLTGARTGVIPPGAQPWVLALIAVWIIPEVVATVPLLIDAMQIISPSARWGAVAQIFANIQIGSSLSGAPLTLLILLSLLHMAFETARPAALDIGIAIFIALGLIVPVIAWQWGYPNGLGQIVSMGRSGAMEPGTAVLAGLAALSWRLAQLAMFLAVVRLIRLPLSQIAAR